jgi:hypothetical protein
VVVGYSGRDESVMQALDDALGGRGAFPAGLFWLHRGERPLVPRVAQLLIRAAAAGVESAAVVVENFDEALHDLLRLLPGLDTSTLDTFAKERRRWTAAPRPAGTRGWPAVRLNALPVVQSPTVCRRVVCQVGGYVEARAAVQQADVDVLVARTRMGVLAFGADSAVRAAFQPHAITDFDLHSIEAHRLRYESGERGLLRDALIRAVARHRGLDVVRRRSCDLVAPMYPQAASWAPLRRLVGTLTGTVAGYPELRWREGLSTRLDWADDRLWLLFEPHMVFDGMTGENKAAATDFARERTVKRYNRVLNDLIDFWAEALAGDGGDLRALGIADGVDAVFRLSAETGFSQRAGA